MVSRISHLRRASLLSLVTVVASAGMAACGSSGSKPATNATGGTPPPPAAYPTSHTLNLSFLQDPGQPPDPDVYYAGEGLLLTRNMYQGLLQYKSGTAKRILEPELATSWTISKDGLT